MRAMNKRTKKLDQLDMDHLRWISRDKAINPLLHNIEKLLDYNDLLYDANPDRRNIKELYNNVRDVRFFIAMHLIPKINSALAINCTGTSIASSSCIALVNQMCDMFESVYLQNIADKQV